LGDALAARCLAAEAAGSQCKARLRGLRQPAQRASLRTSRAFQRDGVRMEASAPKQQPISHRSGP